MASGDVVLFDVGETLGSAHDEPGSPVPRLEIFPHVLPVLERLRQSGTLLGLISSTGTATAAQVDRMLERAGLLTYFPQPDLRIYSSVVGLSKYEPAIFELAIGRALRILKRLPGTVVFVGESRTERDNAVKGGMKAAPHPLLAESVLAGGRPVFLLLRGRRDDIAKLADLFSTAGVVPMHRSEVGADSEILALATDRAIAPLQAGGLTVTILPGAADAVGDDLYILRGVPRSTVFAGLADEGFKPLHEVPGGIIAALGPGRTIDDFHVGEGHGHNLKLLADPTLLFRRASSPAFASASIARAAFAEPTLAPEELATLAATITEARFEQVLRFVSGIDGRPNAVGNNRHVLGPQMRAVTDGLIAEFARIGQGAFTVSGHRFEITGRDVLNDVPGASVTRRITLHNVIADLPGESDEIVLVTAHLDSTAAGTFGHAYDPSVNAAPGVDDDASGVAAVLLIAEFMRSLFAGRKPARTLRFALFNAEEQGLIGSGRYTRALAAAGAKITAVFQMDMIAFNSSAPNIYEIHAGTSSRSASPANPEVESASLAIANFASSMGVMLAAEGLSILTPAQVFASPDPASGYSDHASFHDRGYPAIVVSEDFFPTNDATADGNPHYHLASDQVFDLPYATSIARVVCAAALRTADPAAAPAFADAAAFAAGPGAGLVEVSGRLVATGDAAPAGGTVTLRSADARASSTIAEAALEGDGSFTLKAPPGSYHVVARTQDGAPLASTHETPFALEAGKAVHLVLDAKRPVPLTEGAHAGRRSMLLRDMTLDAQAADVTPDEILDMARAMVAPERADAGTQFAAPASAARSSNDDDDPKRTLCGTERLRKLDRLAELQGYADPAIVKLKVRDILAMGESGFATRTHLTPNFVISYQTGGPAAVENDLSDFDVIEPGSNPSRVLATLPGGTVPAYVRLVAFWLERSLQSYISAPFSMRNPAANGRLSAFINSDDFGSANRDGFYINNRLPPDLVCAVAVHELFHMVQYAYDGPGSWRPGVFEGGATFAEDTVADLMNRYLDEAGVNFNGIGLLAEPNQSLFSEGARYKSSLFWRYLAEQRSHLVDEPTIGVDAYRRVIEECAEHGYSTEAVSRAIRSLPFDAELCAFSYAAGMGDVPASNETTFGNFALALYLKDLPTPPDARFAFRENKENIHIDDAVRLVIPGAPTTETLISVKCERGRVSGDGTKLVFQREVAPLASRYVEAEIAPEAAVVEVSVTAAASFSGLVQIVTIEEDGSLRDIVRSDKGRYRRRLANALGGRRLSKVVVIVSGGEGSGSVQVSLQAVETAADIMITRWNSEPGREYHIDPRGAAWTWISPDLWFEPADDGNFVVKLRLRNKGGKRADNVSCALAYRPGAEPEAGAPWLPILDAGGAVQRIAGESIEPGAAHEFTLPWKPASVALDGIFTLRAEAACPHDANPDNTIAYSRLGITPAESTGLAALAMTSALAGVARQGAIAAFARPQPPHGTLSSAASGLTTGRTLRQAPASSLRTAAGSAVTTVARAPDADDPARRTLPGALAAYPALTMRLHRPDGSLAPGATLIHVEEAPAAQEVAGSGDAPAWMASFARAASMSRPPSRRPSIGLIATAFWGISRHEAIATAAERSLNAKAVETIARITAPLGDGIGLSALAGWADTVKRRRPRPGDDEDTVAFLTDARNADNDGWHYVNIPCHADGYDRAAYPPFTRDDDVVQMIAESVRVLTGASDRFSALNALRLVTHLVGDVHQPIHVGCGYIDRSTDPARLVLDPEAAASQGLSHDQGGNRLLLPSSGSLHSYWDGRLGSVGAGDDGEDDHDHGFAPPELKALSVQRLAKISAALPPARLSFRNEDDPARWAESWATDSLIAAREAYATLRITGPQGNKFKVSWEGKAAYDTRCTPIANARLAMAVRNLASLLNRVLGPTAERGSKGS